MTRELLSPTKAFDTLVQIAVSGLVLAHYSSYKRQYMTEIQIIRPSDKRILGITELQDDQLSAGFQDTVHLL